MVKIYVNNYGWIFARDKQDIKTSLVYGQTNMTKSLKAMQGKQNKKGITLTR